MSDRPASNPIPSDPAEVARQFEAFTKQGQEIFQTFMQHQLSGTRTKPFDHAAIGKAFWEWNRKLMADPSTFFAAQQRYWEDSAKLFHATGQRLAGKQADPVISPEKGDRRFKDAAWNEEVVFDHLKQSYLLSARFAHALVDGVDDLDERTREKVDFYTRRYIESVSPSNFAATHPAVIRKTRESGGKNLIKGFGNLLRDLERGEGELKITMTDHEAFRLGENLAYTPGSVIFENEMMQLIQYDPSTETVHERPLLIVPPWINKYYVLDLKAENSMVKWLVDQGYTVFLISWVNPGAELAGKGFEDYMLEGPIAAMDAIERAIGQRQVNIAGYCIGGTLTAATLAYLAARGRERIASATLMACMIDFTDPGELSVFIDDEQLATLKAAVNRRGYLSGDDMAGVWSLMRANDLIWSHVVNNYLLAEEAIPFDMVYWFQDSTRLPAKMITWYLENVYHKNLLVKPGGLSLDGTPIDLSEITTPLYFLSTEEDHICPWESTYHGAGTFKGTVTFVLGGSGHNAGVVNPPTKSKYGYRTNDRRPTDPMAWLADAEHHDGSWWPHWSEWLAKHSAERVAARRPADGGLSIIEPAPGRYVKMS